MDDQRIWLSERQNWGKTRHNQPQVVVSDTSFFWKLSPCKKSKVLIDSFQRYWWSNNTTIWLDKRHNWLHPSKSGSLRFYLCSFSNVSDMTIGQLLHGIITLERHYDFCFDMEHIYLVYKWWLFQLNCFSCSANISKKVSVSDTIKKDIVFTYQ